LKLKKKSDDLKNPTQRSSVVMADTTATDKSKKRRQRAFKSKKKHLDQKEVMIWINIMFLKLKKKTLHCLK